MAFFTGKEGGIEKTSTLNKEQEELLKKLGPWATSKIGEGLPGWEGEFVAPLSEYEQLGLGKLGQYISEGLPETTQFGLGKYKEALTGMSPEATRDWYMKYVAPGEQRYLTETTLPTIKEAMVPGGTLRSTGTEEAISKAVSEFGTGQLGRIGEAIMSERAGAREALGMLPAMYEMEAGEPLRKAEAASRLGALPRLLEQQELTNKIAEFVRTTPELSPILDLAMEILKTQTQAAFYREPETSPFMQLLEVGAKGLGTYLGAGGTFGLGGGGGGAEG